jgi:hypothetical protein
MSGSTKQTTSNTVDPALMALYQQNYNTAQGVANRPYQPYAGELVAPFAPAQTQAQGLLGNIATGNVGDSALASAVGNAQGVLGYTPPAIAAPQISTQQIAAPQISGGSLANTDLTPYLNPYQSDVVNSTLAQLTQARGMAQRQTNQQATAENAFGGSRSGVANALTNQYYDQDTANTLANLNAQNFTQAQNAAQSDIARQLTAAQANQGAGLTASQANAANALSASNASAGNTLAAGQANTNAGLAAQNLGLNASNLLSGLSAQQLQQALAKAGALSTGGNQQQQQQQAVDTSAYQQFLNKWNYPLEQQQLRNQALGLIPLQQTQTTTQTQNPGLLGILGGILNGAQTAASLGAFG